MKYFIAKLHILVIFALPNSDLRFTIYDLRFTIYDLRFTIWNLEFGIWNFLKNRDVALRLRSV
ncbi:hypothetical protein MB09_05925 [Aequorivita vladivostokensis]|uniref:Uncharacterized protein n=1 Tax=Aequorivita vladivostokensis TaxID=171194 RepID=A0ABR5DJM8_9FLAO|nr:hypothetical protein MB09_05925 [Aequorivita vladivostokensis]